MIIVLLAAILPALVLIGYICFKDRLFPEPTKYILKAFLFGMLSAPVSILISVPLGWLGAFSASPDTLFGHFFVALFAAGIPEETAKLLMLWLVLRKNPAFDERFDGIVYAVCVGMGFALVENVGYLFDSANWIATGIVRGLVSVPGHYVFAILMGYYYSLAHFSIIDNRRNRILTLAAPVAAHTVFDFILMISGATSYYAVDFLLTGVFFIGFFHLQKLGYRNIMAHLATDARQVHVDESPKEDDVLIADAEETTAEDPERDNQEEGEIA